MATHGDRFSGNLARLGFVDSERAQKLLDELGEPARPLVPLVARSADPDQALFSLAGLAEALEDGDALLRELADDEGTSMRLLSVLGASQALGDHLRRHPEHWRELTDPTLGSTRPSAHALRDSLVRAVGGDASVTEPVAGLPYDDALDALRVEYRRLLLRLARLPPPR